MGGAVNESGYAIIPQLLSPSECDALIETLESAHLGRAGARHLMALEPIKALADDERLRALVYGDLCKPLRAPTVRKAAPPLDESSPFSSGRDTAVPFRATLFNKTAKVNWLIPWHQDTALPLTHKVDDPDWGPWSQKSGIWYAHAPEWALKQVLALRIHLDASTQENGPLRVIPGSHQRLLTDAEVDSAVAVSAGSAVDCLAPRGGVIAMRPLILHASSKVENDLPRRVLHIEYATRLVLCPGIELAVS